jgi:hypothetical protein
LNAAAPTIRSIVLRSIYLDQEGTAENVQIGGTGGLSRCVLQDSLFADTTLPSGNRSEPGRCELSFTSLAGVDFKVT